MTKLVDRTGIRYGRLVAIERAPNKGKHTMWLCQCDCGNQTIVMGNSLNAGNTRSCGCLCRENMLRLVTKHGMTGTPEFISWSAMHQRCNNPNSASYYLYGERGITIDPRWDDFAAFYADMGPRPGTKRQYSIDRIDNDGPYSPENCRWATQREQCNNRRYNHLLTFNDRTMNITQWARELGIDRGTLRYRIDKAGWSIEKAFTTPVK